MNSSSKRIRKTGLLTLLCIMLLSTNAMAAEAQSQSNEQENQTVVSSTDSQTASEDTNIQSEEAGPGIQKKAEPAETEPVQTSPSYIRGTSLGLFSATAYCPRSGSSGKQNRTYSGTVPQAQHTISADITVLPIGTKVMIDDVIYTVEDTGSSIKGNKIDIYFGSRSEALAFGRQTKELFAVIEQ